MVKKNELLSKNTHKVSSECIEKSPNGIMVSNVMLFDKAQNLRSNVTALQESASLVKSSMTSSSNNFMNRYQTRGLVKADNRKIVLRQNVELKHQDANDSEVLESNPVQRLTLFQNSKRDYRSAHNFDL